MSTSEDDNTKQFDWKINSSNLSFLPDFLTNGQGLVVIPENQPQVTVGDGQSHQRDHIGHQEENDLICVKTIIVLLILDCYINNLVVVVQCRYTVGLMHCL